MADTNLDNTDGAINNALYGTGGELAGSSENEVVDSTSNATTYTLTNANGQRFSFDPDQIVNLGDGYTLLVEARSSRAVIVDQHSNTVDVWGDPHLTRTKSDGSVNGAFEFINNMTFYLPNEKRITLETSSENVNGGMTFVTGIQILDVDGNGEGRALLTELDLDRHADTVTVSTFNNAQAWREENSVQDGVEAHVDGDLNSIAFYNEDGSAASGNNDPFTKGGQKNDTVAEIGLSKAVHNETLEMVFDLASIEAAMEEAELPPESSSIMIVLFVIFQMRQENIQDYMRVQVDMIGANNATMAGVNDMLTAITATMKGDANAGDNQEIHITSAEMDQLIKLGVLDPTAANFSDGVGGVDGKGDYNNAKLQYVKQALTARAEELQNLTNRDQQKMQYTSGNLNSTSEAIYSFIESYTRTLKSGSTKVGNG